MGTNAPQETTNATGTATGPRLHVALSGGGHRATLYALGALQYLVDAGLARDVVAVASVSGGSIANGRAAQEVDLRTATAADFRARVTLPLATRIAHGGTLFATPRTWVFLVTEVLLGLVLLVCCLPCTLPLDSAWRVGVFFAAFVPFVWLLPRRGALHDHALSRFWLHDAQDRPTLLRDTHGAVDHVFCATDLEGQHHVYFAQRFVWSHDHGRGVPGTVRLSTVVQASAAFPGGFPPRVLPKSTFAFRAPARAEATAGRTKRLVLADGGVYDNMGEQWAGGYAARMRAEDALPTPDPARRATRPDRSPERVLVVNASARPAWRPFSSGWKPLWSEVASLMRVVDVMFGQTTSKRRQSLRTDFDDGRGFDGAFVSIDRSPAFLARRSLRRHDGSEARAREVLARLGLPADGTGDDRWAAEAEQNQAVGTTLSTFPPETVERLLRHGYLGAMCNGHVLFRWPLCPIPEFGIAASV